MLACSPRLQTRTLSRTSKGSGRSCGCPASASPAAVASSTNVIFKYVQLERTTQPGINLHDITPEIRAHIQAVGLKEGYVNVLSRHTTTAVTINEAEPRLWDDIRQWLRKLAPPTDPYLHNDMHVRQAPEGWPGGHAAWVQQEPINAHSHLLSIMIGNTQTIPVSDGKLCIGTWQSVLLVELDGPRPRTVGLQLVGQAAAEA